jgi:hypothetical protein
MSTPDAPVTGWFTSSFSQGDNPNCVEANLAPDAVYVRHSRHPLDAALRYPPAQWDAFICGMQAGEFDPGNH